MAHLVPVINGQPFPSDSANTASSIVECDANGDVVRSGFSAGAIPASAPVAGNFLFTAGALMAASQTQTVANTLATSAACVQKLDATAGAFNQTLPVAATSADLIFFFVKIDSTGNIPTLKGNGTDNITTPSGTANTYAGLTTKGSHIALYCDGTQWWQIA